MSLIVQKYGGTSVADSEKLFHVAQKAIDEYKKENEVVVVVSAQGKMTDWLYSKAKEISENPSKRELDALLSSGEQISASLLAMTIQKLGYPAICYNGRQAGIYTDNKYGNATIQYIDIKQLKKVLKDGNIVVVTGFQGCDNSGNITTLGRGGSDTTAVALAAYLEAEVCETYTDVNGVYSADPRIVKNAIKFNEMSYDEMLQLAKLGAKVLHDKSVALAKKYNTRLLVKSSFHYGEGTLICKCPFKKISGITKKDDIVSIVGTGVQEYSEAIIETLAKSQFEIKSIMKRKKYMSIKTDHIELAMNKIHEVLFES